MQHTIDPDRLDWDKPTFIVGTPCARDGCNRPADGFMIDREGEVEPGGVCRKHGKEAVAGSVKIVKFEPGIVFRAWQNGNLIRGVPVRRSSETQHIGMGHINRTYCGRDTKGLKLIPLPDYLKSERPTYRGPRPIVCSGCGKKAKAKVVTV